MVLVTGDELLTAADKGKYAVGAFNVNNMEILQAVVTAAEGERSPVIIAATEGAIKYAGIEYIKSMAYTAAEKSDVPMALHLDHGKDIDMIKKCIEYGFTSVMIDASAMPLEENIAETRKVVDIAHPAGVSVEAELGRLKGVEDNVSVAERDAILVNPKEAERFVMETEVNSLAPAVGTSHGAFKFKGKPELDFDRLAETKRLTGVPLVLHGASSVPEYITEKASKYGAKLPGAKGVPEEQVKRAIGLGVCKVNIDTDLRLSLTAAVREVLAENPEVFDPRKILGPARDAINDVVKYKMKLLGSSGKA